MDGRLEQNLIEDVRRGNASSAYLITCDQPKELDLFAQQFLLALYCENKTSCGVCHACKMILSDNSPDVLKIEPEKRRIDNIEFKFNDVKFKWKLDQFQIKWKANDRFNVRHYLIADDINEYRTMVLFILEF